MNLTKKIFISMISGLLIGSLLNFCLQSLNTESKIYLIIDTWIINGILFVIGKMFIASLKMMVVPLVLVSLILGTSSLGNNSRMGIIALKGIIFYMCTTFIAISLAIFIANLTDPGIGLNQNTDTNLEIKDAPPIKMYLQI